MRVLTLKTQTPANITKYTIRFKYYFNGASGVYGENGTPNANYANIYIYLYIYISEISIESALASLAQIYGIEHRACVLRHGAWKWPFAHEHHARYGNSNGNSYLWLTSKSGACANSGYQALFLPPAPRKGTANWAEEYGSENGWSWSSSQCSITRDSNCCNS